MKRDEIFQSVTDRISQSLRQGRVPWRKPWGETQTEIQSLALPVNAKTSKPYQGVNIPLLWLAGFPSPYWATEKVWNELGATVEEYNPVEIYFSSFGGRFGKKIPFFKVYKVYNLVQVRGCDGLRTYALNQGEPDFAPVDDLIEASGVTIMDGNHACYDIGMDVIFRPPRKYFRSDIGYYTTELHEMAHWTGNSKRLNRRFGGKDSPQYAEEELVAELATCFVAAALEIPERMDEMPNHVSYIGDWLTKLREDSTAFFRASAVAQKAANYLLKFARVRIS